MPSPRPLPQGEGADTKNGNDVAVLLLPTAQTADAGTGRARISDTATAPPAYKRRYGGGTSHTPSSPAPPLRRLYAGGAVAVSEMRARPVPASAV